MIREAGHGALPRRPIRVTHFQASGGLYGAERGTLALIDHLPRNAFASTVLTLGSHAGAGHLSARAAELGHEGIHVKLGGRLNPSLIQAVRAILRRTKPDVVHTHGFKADVLGFLGSLGTGVALVSTVHGVSDLEGVRVRWYEAVARRCLSRFDRVISVSDSVTDRLVARGLPGRVIKTIPNGVDLRPFTQKWDGPGPHARAAPLRVVYVGRLHPVKRVHDLLAAFSVLGDPAATLTIVGDGPDRPSLERAIAARDLGARVQLTGQVDDVLPFLAGANVLVLPSEAEGRPRSVMEAFAAGVAVVASDVAGTNELVRDGLTGRLYPVGQVEALASALASLRDTPGLAGRLAAGAARWVVEAGDAATMARRTGSVYLEVLRTTT